LIGPQPPALCKVASTLRSYRSIHKRKVEDAKAQCMQALGVNKHGKCVLDGKDPRVVSLRELQQQLQCFDESLLQVWSKLKDPTALIEEDEDIGLSQLERSNTSNYEVSTKDANYRVKREAYRLQAALPALAKRSELERAIRKHPSVIVRGATGSGKSTQVPAYLAEMVKLEQLKGRRVLCTQPRKVAAISLASRVSEEWYCGRKDMVGQAVGYRAGGAPKTGKHTLIEYLTEGSLLNMLLGGKRKLRQQGADREESEEGSFRGNQLHDVACIVLDEAHERTMVLDVILGVLKAGQRDGRWPRLKIVVTSATLDVKLFSRYLDSAPIIEIPGRMFPVNVVYKPLPDTSDDYLRAAVDLVAEIHVGQPDSGDVLVFLTGEAEVVQAVERLEKVFRLAKPDSPFLALPLFGKQTADEQAAVFAKAPAGTRKIIFSTDIAETSVTIDGVRHVIDSGMTKEAIYDVKRNVTVLEVGLISRSSATQRCGRAGRTAPGTCYRLYSQVRHQAADNSCNVCIRS
jgi:ATP-dependent RNA helicase DHX8/PRP22